MLTIAIPIAESYNEATGEFVSTDINVDLEHSLASVSKWESVYEKPFLIEEPKTSEETLGYIRAMIISPGVSPEVLSNLTNDNINAINNYINQKMTATWFAEDTTKRAAREIITSELIYYWMTMFNIPTECEHWHLNRLLTLVRVCNVKNASQKELSPQDAAQQRQELNAMRRAKLGSNG